MTRIIAGKAGSLSLRVPNGPTRPTSDRVREAIFSSLESLVDLDGASVVDLYAGSGALGLEAASRGASSVVFVDNQAASVRTISDNIDHITPALDQEVSLSVYRKTAEAYCRELADDTFFDVVFLDPPYELSNDELLPVLESLISHLSRESIVVVERSAKTPEALWPGGFELRKSKTYGDTAVYFLAPNR